MHPSPFQKSHKLSDWPACQIELHCCGVVIYPAHLMLKQRGDMTFDALLAKLRCKKCGGRPAPVYLCAGHNRTFNGGHEPDWAIELVPMPSSRK